MSDGRAEGMTWGSRWLSMVLESWPALLFLAMFATVLHPLAHFDAWLFERYLRTGVAAAHELRGLKEPTPPQVHVFSFSPEVVKNRLELRDVELTADTIARTGGVRPLDRRELGKALADVAKGLELRKQRANGDEQLRVLALDLDLTPLLETTGGQPIRCEGKADQGLPPEFKEMIDVIARLRKVVPHLLIAAMTRNDPGALGLRDKFLSWVHCTSAGSNTAEVTVVSTQLLVSPDDVLEKFPDRRQRESSATATCRQLGISLPRIFPALGVVARELLGANDAHLLLQRDGSLTTAPKLIDDALRFDDAANCIRDYYKPDTFIDWRTVPRGIVLAGPLSQSTSDGWSVVDGRDLAYSKAPVVIIAADSGPEVDRYRTPLSASDRQPGAVAHAAIAATARWRPVRSYQALLIDLAVGALFLVVWTGGANRWLVTPPRRAPGVWRRARRLHRIGLWLVGAASVAALATGAKLLLGLSWSDMRAAVQGHGVAWFCIAVGTFVVLPVALLMSVDATLFGHPGSPVQRMPWTREALRRLLPLVVAAAVGSLCVTVLGMYLINDNGDMAIVDIVPILLGLVVHAYAEAANGQESVAAHRPGDVLSHQWETTTSAFASAFDTLSREVVVDAKARPPRHDVRDAIVMCAAWLLLIVAAAWTLVRDAIGL